MYKTINKIKGIALLAGLSVTLAAGSADSQQKAGDGDWTAHWIQAPGSTGRDGAELDGSKPMPVFRREFGVRQKPVKATLRIAGLGQYEARLGSGNGMRLVAPRGLHQAWTDYRKTVTYESYDVTKMLSPGRAVLGVMLGNGMYNVQRTKGRYTKLEGSFGPPKLIAELRLKYADGKTETVGTDAEWKVLKGPVTFSSTYGGEDFDARKEASGWDRPGFNDAEWSAAVETDGPGGALMKAIAPDVREGDFHLPVKVTDVAPNIAVYDLGQNFAGVPFVRLHGPAGAVLKLTPGDVLKPAASVSHGSSGSPMWWSYTLGEATDGEGWGSQFGY